MSKDRFNQRVASTPKKRVYAQFTWEEHRLLECAARDANLSMAQLLRDRVMPLLEAKQQRERIRR